MWLTCKYWPLGPYILAHGRLTLATPSGLAGKQSWGKIRERGRSKEVAVRLGLPMLQNRPLGSWNEANSMPTHRPDFGVICVLIWPNRQTGHAEGQLNCPRNLLLLVTYLESLLWLFLLLFCPLWENKTRGAVQWKTICLLTLLIHKQMGQFTALDLTKLSIN